MKRLGDFCTNLMYSRPSSLQNPWYKVKRKCEKLKQRLARSSSNAPHVEGVKEGKGRRSRANTQQRVST